MSKHAYLFFAVFCASACGGASEHPEPLPVTPSGASDDPRFRALLATLEADMQAHHVPGAAIAIVEHGHLVASAGIGEKREGTDAPVAPTTLFRVASLSKMITAATAMKLVDEGRLDVSRPVTDYVPLAFGQGVSVENLLTHTSGIPDFEVSQSCDVGPGAREAFFAAHSDQPLWTTPGAVWNYSNQGFGVAGWVVEAASGQPFEDAAQTRVLGPAGMTTATYDPAVARAGDHATGHERKSGKPVTFVEPDAYDCAATRSAAGVIASVLDYAHFAETILAGGGSMISPSSFTAMTTGHVDTDLLPSAQEHYGYGLFVRDGYKGLHVLRHTGSDPGYRSSIWMVPDAEFAVIVFYNAGNRSPDTVAKAAVDDYLGLTNVAAPVETTPPSTWSAYVGNYVDPYGVGAISVTLEDDALHLSAPAKGADDVTLVQTAGDTFEVPATSTHDSASVTFYPGTNGPASYLVTREGVGRR